MIFRYRLSTEKRRNIAKQLIDSVYYLSDRVTEVRIGEADELEVAYAGEDLDAFQAKLDRYLNISLQTRFSAKTVTHDNRGAIQLKAGSSDMAQYLSVGGLRLEGEVVLLEQAFDRIFREMAEKHGASLRRYPSFLSSAQIKNSGYLQHFPQNIYGICEIPHEYDHLQHYRNQINQAQGTSDLLQHNGLFLQPCVCFHVYEELARSGQSTDDLQLFTAVGHCYRHEHRSRLSEIRLREFYMREIVYVGKADRVVQMRAQLIEETWALFAELGLRGFIESATDPFYYAEDNVLQFYQSSSALKYELRLATDDQPDFSIASFNLCGHVLCQAFGVDRCGEETHSGCTGFGIDRWIQAFLAVHGHSAAHWPAKMSGYIR
jgi:seryl-tRNA synthetase